MSYQGEDIFSAPAINSAILATTGVEMVETTYEDQFEPFRLHRFLASLGGVIAVSSSKATSPNC